MAKIYPTCYYTVTDINGLGAPGIKDGLSTAEPLTLGSVVSIMGARGHDYYKVVKMGNPDDVWLQSCGYHKDRIPASLVSSTAVI